jgi:hypothetical protein
MASLPYIQVVFNDMDINSPRVELHTYCDKAAALGLSVAEVEGALYGGYGPLWASTIYGDRYQYRVLLELDPAFFGQRLQIIFRRAGSGKSQARGDLGARWRHPASLQEASNPVEDLPLARCKSTRQWVSSIRRALRKSAFFGICTMSASAPREHPSTH